LNVDIRVCDSWKMDCEPNDMLFIDGDHSYEAVKKDFTHHWNSLKDDGVCLAHDYGIEETYRCIGVTRFIDEWVNEGFAKVIDKTRSMIALQKIKNY